MRVCDGVYSNLRGDQPRKLGLTYEQLRDVNPRIVCCSLSGFGMTGPRASEGGYDYMMQGLAGWQSLTGEPGGPPTKSGLSLVDLSGGYASAIALLAGIWRARRDGVGCDCDVSLFETALHELMYIGPWAATHGFVPPRRHNSAHPTIVPFQNFEASDGWFVVGAAKQVFWERLCEVIGRARPAGGRAVRDDGGAQRASRRAPAGARRGVPGRGRWTNGSRRSSPRVSPPRASTPSRRRSSTPRPRRAGPSSSTTIPRSAASARSARRCGSREGETTLERPAERGPFRGEHTEAVLVELCGYTAGAGARARGRRVSSATGCRRRERDGDATCVGYGASPPDPRWPGGKRVALNLVLNYEEGGENTPLEGDPASEAYLHEVIGAPATVGRRNLNTESMFEFGSRVGFWRVHRLVTSFGMPLTVFAVGRALEQNPAAARAMVDAGWEVASHGWRWIDYGEFSEDEEREHLRRSIAAIERRLRRAPRRVVHGPWDRGDAPPRRRGTAASSTTRTPTPTSSRTGSRSPDEQHLVVPYTLDANDFKFLLPNGFVTADDFATYLIDSLDELAAEGGRMLSVGLHCRIVGRPGQDAGAPTLPRARRGPRRRLGRDAGRHRAPLARRAPTTHDVREE